MHDLYHIANILGNSLQEKSLTVTTAESCTAGGIAYALTSIPGSSQWFNCGWVTYSNASKHELLGVSNNMLEKYGAVSEQVVKGMAAGALKRAKADIAMAVSGVAGPDGATAEKPVGTIWLAIATPEKTFTKSLLLSGDRENIRKQTIMHVLQECNRIVKTVTKIVTI